MAESGDSSSQSFFRRHWEGYKEFWSERFSFLSNYSRFVKRDEPLPSWSSADVEEFIASDPVHGPVLRTAREAVNYGLTGSAVGAVSTAGVAWKYSKSLHGAALSFLAGGVFWVDIWAGNCKSHTSTLQVGHLGCTDQVYGVVGKEGPRDDLRATGFLVVGKEDRWTILKQLASRVDYSNFC